MKSKLHMILPVLLGLHFGGCGSPAPISSQILSATSCGDASDGDGDSDDNASNDGNDKDRPDNGGDIDHDNDLPADTFYDGILALTGQCSAGNGENHDVGDLDAAQKAEYEAWLAGESSDPTPQLTSNVEVDLDSSGLPRNVLAHPEVQNAINQLNNAATDLEKADAYMGLAQALSKSHRDAAVGDQPDVGAAVLAAYNAFLKSKYGDERDKFAIGYDYAEHTAVTDADMQTTTDSLDKHAATDTEAKVEVGTPELASLLGPARGTLEVSTSGGVEVSRTDQHRRSTTEFSPPIKKTHVVVHILYKSGKKSDVTMLTDGAVVPDPYALLVSGDEFDLPSLSDDRGDRGGKVTDRKEEERKEREERERKRKQEEARREREARLARERELRQRREAIAKSLDVKHAMVGNDGKYVELTPAILESYGYLYETSPKLMQDAYDSYVIAYRKLREVGSRAKRERAALNAVLEEAKSLGFSDAVGAARLKRLSERMNEVSKTNCPLTPVAAERAELKIVKSHFDGLVAAYNRHASRLAEVEDEAKLKAFIDEKALTFEDVGQLLADLDEFKSGHCALLVEYNDLIIKKIEDARLAGSDADAAKISKTTLNVLSEAVRTGAVTDMAAKFERVVSDHVQGLAEARLKNQYTEGEMRAGVARQYHQELESMIDDSSILNEDEKAEFKEKYAGKLFDEIDSWNASVERFGLDAFIYGRVERLNRKLKAVRRKLMAMPSASKVPAIRYWHAMVTSSGLRINPPCIQDHMALEASCWKLNMRSGSKTSLKSFDGFLWEMETYLDRYVDSL